jgi:hypothetical protein
MSLLNLRDSKKLILTALDQFMTSKMDLIKVNKSEMDISVFLSLASIAIHLDQITLKFLLCFFSLNKRMLDLDNDTTVQTTTNIDNTIISNVNDYKLSETDFLQLSNNRYSYFIRRLIITDFQISLSYNPQYLDIDKHKEVMEKLNVGQLQDLKLILKPFDFKGRKRTIELIHDVYDYWKKDILESQIIKAYLSSISYIRPFKNIIGGFLELFIQPYKQCSGNNSVEDGIVEGVRRFVVVFTTETLQLGEQV